MVKPDMTEKERKRMRDPSRKTLIRRKMILCVCVCRVVSDAWWVVRLGSTIQLQTSNTPTRAVPPPLPHPPRHAPDPEGQHRGDGRAGQLVAWLAGLRVEPQLGQRGGQVDAREGNGACLVGVCDGFGCGFGLRRVVSGHRRACVCVLYVQRHVITIKISRCQSRLARLPTERTLRVVPKAMKKKGATVAVCRPTTDGSDAMSIYAMPVSMDTIRGCGHELVLVC